MELLRGSREESRDRVVLTRRAARWVAALGEIVRHLGRVASSRLPSEIAMSLWRFVCHAWCTMARSCRVASASLPRATARSTTHVVQ